GDFAGGDGVFTAADAEDGQSVDQLLHHRPGKERHHDLVVPRDLVSDAATAARRPLDHVHARTVVPDHVEVGCDEPAWCTVVHVAAHRERLEEHLRHDDGRAEV